MKSALIIINPVSPNLPSRGCLREAADWLKTQDWRADWAPTRWAGEATPIAARAAREGRDLVVVCGGDGTINEAINGLAGSQTPLAVTPPAPPTSGPKRCACPAPRSMPYRWRSTGRRGASTSGGPAPARRVDTSS